MSTNLAVDCSTYNSNKKQIAEAFGRAAKSYDQHAAFQRDVGTRLINKLPRSLQGLKVLDLGCGTGFFSQQLLKRGASVTCADLSREMLEQAKQRCGTDCNIEYQQADAESLPFDNDTFDIVFSSLALQWCDDLSRPLKEIKRVTKQGGICVFSTLAEGSLSELREAWKEIDAHQHVNRFHSANMIKIALAQSQCEHYQLDFPEITLWYNRAMELMRDLKGIGATHVSGRSNGLASRSALQKVELAYSRFSNEQDRIPATYNVCLGVIEL